MARKLSADQVLEVAEQMERSAVKFYRRAAGVCDDPKVCRLFVDLARWERQHVRVFSEMRSRLSGPSKSSPGGQNRELGRFVLEQMDQSPPKPALPPIFGDCEYPSNDLVGGWTKVMVLKTAIQKEKDTISYFTSLKNLIPGRHNIRVIKAVICEEERHMKILVQSLEQVPER